VTIYTLNVVHKAGDTWHDGTAVHYVLWQNRVNTAIGNWLAFHEPSWLSPFATYGTLVVESTIPLLVLVPWGRRFTRAAAFLLAVGLHGGIALVMTLGPFSYAMISLLSLMLPAEVLERARALVPRRWLLRTYRRRAQLLRLMAKVWHEPPVLPGDSRAREAARKYRRVVRESAVALLIVINALEVGVDNAAIRYWVKVEQPAPFATLVAYLRMIQSWNMFAPDAPIEDGMLVIDARTADGRHIDPFTGKAPDFELGMNRPVPQSLIVTDYLFAMHTDSTEGYRGQLANYLQRWHTLHGRPESERIVAYEAWWLSHRSPPPGSTQPFEFRKELVFTGP
jgi:hypothetical protein